MQIKSEKRKAFLNYLKENHPRVFKAPKILSKANII